MANKKSIEAEYVKKLEGVIKQMLAPLRDLPLNIVIESISGKKVIPFDKKNPKHVELLNTLKTTARDACEIINATGILSARANEVGNKVEAPIKQALRDLGFSDADTPINQKGKRQATGYPDIGFTFKELYIYVECKTYNKNNVSTTQRSFYLSPSKGFKVTRDAIHVVLSIEVERKRDARAKGKTYGVYVAKGWKIVQAERINVDIKREFNSDNKRMYAAENILAEGRC